MNPNDLLMKAHIDSLKQCGLVKVAEKAQKIYEVQRVEIMANEN